MNLPITINKPKNITIGTSELGGIHFVTISNDSMPLQLKHLCTLRINGVSYTQLLVIKSQVCNNKSQVVECIVTGNSKGTVIKLRLSVWQNPAEPWISLTENPVSTIPWGAEDIAVPVCDTYDITFRAQVISQEKAVDTSSLVTSSSVPPPSPLLKNTGPVTATLNGMALSGVKSVDFGIKESATVQKKADIPKEVHTEFDRVFDFEEGI